ncbi:glycogen/starch synthase [Flavitalea sp. BT771]|uniref:glycogen/starch synthase n=1 Tax=Flavitalea sp. BT771 TaxID=3063329 RepID=UPI0026E4709F|nr:glycogen/starch synthase [Flavitalea sp. BT771]MDO6435731.1 glycogen/starch synthase [Flavitalea sp. BT771]MDV6224616.1 glycogen/starch synthase [Flavitalea sp. BT771]
MIVHLGSEVAPYYKRGGLGDVLGALPRYLSEREPNIVISFYYEGRMHGLSQAPEGEIALLMQGIEYKFVYYYHDDGAVKYYFLNMSDGNVFSDLEPGEDSGRPKDGEMPYQQNASFFAYLYFGKAALQLLEDLQLDPGHLLFHDWHVCGCFAFGGKLSALKERKRFSTILMIHNYEHQGEIFPDVCDYLDEELTSQLMPVFSRYGMATMLSLGLKHADHVATVSATYARELEEHRVPHPGLVFLELIKRKKVHALPNGIDDRVWKMKPHLPEFFEDKCREVVEMKRKARLKITGKYALHCTEAPLVVMLCRLTEQKGITLLMNFWDSEAVAMKKLEALLNSGIGLIVCGHPAGGLTGNVHRRFALAQQRFPGRFSYIPQYSDLLARELLAASDAILCPSLFEPCGLVQLYAMAFGCIPIVRPVGGLRDTVKPYGENAGGSTGFYIGEFSYDSLLATVNEAVDVYKHKKDAWQKMVVHCLGEDHSWDKAKERYFDFFGQILHGEIS